MTYSPQDKYEMALRQARVDIGQGRGNALSKAVDFVVGVWSFMRDEKGNPMQMNWDKINKVVFRFADDFAHFNQNRIEEDYQKWFLENNEKIRQELGLAKSSLTPEQEYYETTALPPSSKSDAEKILAKLKTHVRYSVPILDKQGNVIGTKELTAEDREKGATEPY